MFLHLSLGIRLILSFGSGTATTFHRGETPIFQLTPFRTSAYRDECSPFDRVSSCVALRQRGNLPDLLASWDKRQIPLLLHAEAADDRGRSHRRPSYLQNSFGREWRRRFGYEGRKILAFLPLHDNHLFCLGAV